MCTGGSSRSNRNPDPVAPAPIISVDGKARSSSATIARSRQRGLASMWTRYASKDSASSSPAAAKADKLGG